MKMKVTIRYLCSCMVILGALSTEAYAQQPTLAFPEAEGFGKYAKGGRGGKVLHVTTLKDSGSGSLRAALETSGPRTVVFDVSGIINLSNEITVTSPYLTVAGQTAPDPGVLVRV